MVEKGQIFRTQKRANMATPMKFFESSQNGEKLNFQTKLLILDQLNDKSYRKSVGTKGFPEAHELVVKIWWS